MSKQDEIAKKIAYIISELTSGYDIAHSDSIDTKFLHKGWTDNMQGCK